MPQTQLCPELRARLCTYRIIAVARIHQDALVDALPDSGDVAYLNRFRSSVARPQASRDGAHYQHVYGYPPITGVVSSLHAQLFLNLLFRSRRFVGAG